MPRLLLIRHGQASFGAADYDQLSPLGQRQCERLGAYLAQRKAHLPRVLCGTLRRQQQSLAALRAGFVQVGIGSAHQLGDAETWPELDEYDSQALLQALRPGPLEPADTPEGYRQHFLALRKALLAWMDGTLQPKGMRDYASFRAGMAKVLEYTRQSGSDVLVVSSGGPISTALGLVLQTPAAVTIDFNMRLRNSAITELAFNAKRHHLQGFNALPHLDDLAFSDWITHT